jgi:hypothetical protein
MIRDKVFARPRAGGKPAGLLLPVDVRGGLGKASSVPRLFEVVGCNSTCVSHPEELLADNCALLLQSASALPDPPRADKTQRMATGAGGERRQA